MAKIGVYGGSFNPPHIGHVQAAKAFCQELQLDKLFLIPAAVPPHKKMPPDTPSGEERMEMVRLAMSNLPTVQVDDLELRRSGSSYTADTLEMLKDRYPDDSLYLCMGTDMFQTFDQWYRPDRIAEIAQIVMAHRVMPDRTQLEKQEAAFRERFGKVPILLENDILPVSSTEIRRLLILGGADALLPASVYDYIMEQGLYGTGRCRKRLSFLQLKEASLALHRESRIAHVIGCSETAWELARIHGADQEDARRAGILHDVTKALSGEDQLRLCDKYGIIIDNFERKHTKLLHAVTGAAVAEYVFGENDAVCQAIRWHTSGKADMTTLEKIIYVADYMEPNRDFPGVEELRRLACTDLDAALFMGLEMTAEHLKRQGAIMGRHSLEAMEYLEKQKGMCRSD